MSNIGLSFVIGGLVGSSFKSSIGNVKNSIGGLSEKIQSVSRSRLDIKNLISMSEAGKSGTAEFKTLENRLKLTGIKTENLAGEFGQLGKRLEGLRMRSKINLQITSNIDKIKSEIMSTRGLIATAAGSMGFINAHADILKAQGEIASLGINESGITKITQAAKEFSNKFAGTMAPDFIRASYDIKSGISSLSDEGVAQFTRLAALTGTATKATTADMTKLFALGYGIFRNEFKSDEDFGNQFSNGISSAVQAFRTDGADLIQGVSNLGASGVKMGISFSEQLAVIGKSKDSFNSASDAATGYRAFIDGAGKAQTALGLKFTDASGKMLPMVDILESIKNKYGDSIETVDVQDKLKQAFGSAEAVKTVSALINKTKELRTAQKQLEADMQNGTKTEEMAKAMQRGKELQLLKQQFVSLAASVGSVMYPAFSLVAKVLGGVANGIQFVMEKFRPLGVAISSVVAVVLTLVTVSKTLVITKLALESAWLSIVSVTRIFGIDLSRLTMKSALFGIKTKALTAALWLKNTAFKAVSFTAAGLGKVFSLLGRILSLTALKSYAMSSGFFFQTTVMKFAGLAMKNFTVFQWLLNAAMLGCPITWLIGGIALLGVGAYALIKNWDKVKDFFGGLWESIKGIFGGGVAFISELLQDKLNSWLIPFKAIWSGVKKLKSMLFDDETVTFEMSEMDKPDLNNNAKKQSKFGIDIADYVQPAPSVMLPKNDAKEQTSFTSKYLTPHDTVEKLPNNTLNTQNFTYSPQITIQGNADRADVERVISNGAIDFERQLVAYNERQSRLSYAGGD